MERVEEAIRERRVAVTAIINATPLIVTQEKRCESGKKKESERKCWHRNHQCHSFFVTQEEKSKSQSQKESGKIQH